MGTRILTFTNI